MNIKNVLLLLVLVSLFSCSKDVDLSSDNASREESEIRRDGRNCNPNINFPLPFTSLASAGQLVNEGSCNPENFTTSGSSALEVYYDCRYDNPEELLPPVTCNSIIVPLYDYCDMGDPSLAYINLYPSANPVSSDPNFISAEGEDLGGNSIFTTVHFNSITNYANTVISNATSGMSYDYIEIDFFTTPDECKLSCSCNTTWNSETQTETLLHATNGITLYIKITLCRLNDGDVLGNG